MPQTSAKRHIQARTVLLAAGGAGLVAYIWHKSRAQAVAPAQVPPPSPPTKPEPPPLVESKVAIGQACAGQTANPAWPVLTQVNERLGGQQTPFSDLVQGVSHDDQNWYFSQQYKLWRVPLMDNLYAPTQAVSSKDLRAGLLPPNLSHIDHLGDLEYRDGELFVAGESNPNAILVFDAATLEFKRAMIASAQADMPWLAFTQGPKPLIVTSEFNASRLLFRDQATGELVSSVLLRCGNGNPTTIGRVQGGTVSPDGKLFLSSDDSPGGIYGIDLFSGVVSTFVATPRKERTLGARDEELEGLAWWDLGKGGQLHLVLCHSFHVPVLAKDGVSLRSYAVTPPQANV